MKDVEIEATEPVQGPIVQCAKGGNRHVLGFSGLSQAHRYSITEPQHTIHSIPSDQPH